MPVIVAGAPTKVPDSCRHFDQQLAERAVGVIAHVPADGVEGYFWAVERGSAGWPASSSQGRASK
ncbi:hypothetical protein GFS60_08044 (plasmid) [Rhodococcus sp. WAY2]|nr:hypothetical protein GFS60_08044 [Rhodococcus sp. WAY2]